MRTLIFEPSLTGHHLEYLHHLYIGAAERSEEEYIFAVPKNEWEQMKGKLKWPECNNINLELLDDEECRKLGEGNMLLRSWHISKFIRRIAIACKANRILLISLAGAIPFLPLILPSKIKVSGIIYKIYLRSPKKGVRGLLDRVRYKIMAHSRSMGRAFILNDPRSAERLNRIYQTDRFICLPDPVPTVNVAELRDLRNEFDIHDDAKIFLHFGAMDERKGTLMILKSLNAMTKSELANKVFVFAGRVGDNIKDEFYTLLRQAEKHGARIIVEDEFVSYEMLNNLCHTADCIIIPYLFTDLSSGALGYAAVHNTPVIGPKDGLIGELIRDNGLGVGLETMNVFGLKSALLRIKVNAKSYISNYSITNSIDSFQNIILNGNKSE